MAHKQPESQSYRYLHLYIAYLSHVLDTLLSVKRNYLLVSHDLHLMDIYFSVMTGSRHKIK
ncbi:MAG: hypothetical protein IT250_07880 [Chitinophagaceae bacterium]|nr:hypothetical protein [Chitinophagaceae bacterium]